MGSVSHSVNGSFLHAWEFLWRQSEKKKVDCIFNFQDIMRVTTKVVAHLVGKRHKVHNKDFLLLTSIPQQKHQLIKSIPFLLFQHALMLAALYGTMQGWCFSPSLFWHSEYLGKIRRYWIILLDIKKKLLLCVCTSSFWLVYVHYLPSLLSKTSTWKPLLAKKQALREPTCFVQENKQNIFIFNTLFEFLTLR